MFAFETVEIQTLNPQFCIVLKYKNNESICGFERKTFQKSSTSIGSDHKVSDIPYIQPNKLNNCVY